MDQFIRKLLFVLALLALHITISTFGYYIIGDFKYSIIDCFYMTMITITTIGYGEIIDLNNNPSGRIFTIFVAIFGIGILTYILSNFTAFILEGEINKKHRRKKMEKIIKKLSSHYILCGIEDMSLYIAKELYDTKRDFVIVDNEEKKIEKFRESFNKLMYIIGDPTDIETLEKAGIKNAKGLFAVAEDDKSNIVITITARQANNNLRIVTQCRDIKNVDKIKKAGADSVISPTFIGSLRMTSEMVRPTVVTFLDMMLRDKEKNLRIEEIQIPDLFVGKDIESMNIDKFKEILLLAVKCINGWVYNPPKDYILQKDDTLIVMTTAEERNRFEKILKLMA
ncbi:MAG: potassium channel protein [Calditerrivibrio sp.]|nr:potassium channel protein [Calditerrivibrio sp.]MCA1980157.1 potassium channel protein [Calditerrivibrio sp.]